MKRNMYGTLVGTTRRELKWTQMSLSEKVECALSTISRVETGSEFPKFDLFSRINQALGLQDLSYEQFYMERHIQKAKVEEQLLASLHHDKSEDIERKLKQYMEVMEKGSIPQQQVKDMADLAFLRDAGLELDEYIRRCTEIYEKRTALPEFSKIENITINKVEHLMLYKLAIAHFQLGDYEVAKEIIEGLLKKSLTAGGDYMKKCCKHLTTALAQILIKANKDEIAEKCVSYVFDGIFESFDNGIIFQNLMIQSELFERNDNHEGVELIDKFIGVSEKLINYMRTYKNELNN